MKKLIFCLCCVSLLLGTGGYSAFAQRSVIEVSDIQNESMRQKLGANATAVLSELNSAFFDRRTPDLSNMSISESAKTSILAMWEVSPFRCLITEQILRGLNRQGGYQLRNIPLMLRETKKLEYGVMNFNEGGEIEAFFFAIENQQYLNIIHGKKSVTDLRRRQIILDFVENFRTAYNRKDIVFLDDVFSDDALIITGKIIRKRGDDNMLQSLGAEAVSYQKSTKTEYLKRLQTLFQRNVFINVTFDDIELMQHPKYPEIYGVTLRQKYSSSLYSDDGWLFLAIDFKDESHPIIHVRTWQPSILNGTEFPREEVFSLGHFNFVQK